MGTSAGIWVVGFGLAALAALYGANIIAAICILGTVIVHFLHVIEVKLNKLLDFYGLSITSEDRNR